MDRLTFVRLTNGSTGSWPDPLSVQGLYYTLSGLWPIVHLPSFVALTGPKHDTWLVKSFGAFIAGIGVVLLSARGRDERRLVSRVAVVSAAALAGADTWYVARRRIRPIYLADAAVELLLAGAVLGRRGR